MNNLKYIFLVIPTINGEIFGEPFVSLTIDEDLTDEFVIYQINLYTLEVIEYE